MSSKDLKELAPFVSSVVSSSSNNVSSHDVRSTGNETSNTTDAGALVAAYLAQLLASGTQQAQQQQQQAAIAERKRQQEQQAAVELALLQQLQRNDAEVGLAIQNMANIQAAAAAAAALLQQQKEQAALSAARPPISTSHLAAWLAAAEQLSATGSAGSSNAASVVEPSQQRKQPPEGSSGERHFQPSSLSGSARGQDVTGGSCQYSSSEGEDVVTDIRSNTNVTNNKTATGDGNRKEQQRAANRRSALLCRKRKKQYLEDLKLENENLVRHEQILKGIPDLVVVFDSTGKLRFVSHSIGRFIHYTPSELEGKSFWERLCPESVRLLKAGFMDALDAEDCRSHDPAPLGDGLWNLNLLDKDGSLVSVTLNGVVHFSGERPECFCCIRLKDDSGSTSSSSGDDAQQPHMQQAQRASEKTFVSDSSFAPSASSNAYHSKNPAFIPHGKKPRSMRIDVSGNSSGGTESGNSSD